MISSVKRGREVPKEGTRKQGEIGETGLSGDWSL